MELGDAIKPFYGKKAGDQLTALLEEHLLGAVKLLDAALSGDEAALAAARGAWYQNGFAIADFLSAANPENWPRDPMREGMKIHLDTTLEEAVHRIEGRYEKDLAAYDVVHFHVLGMADTLSNGIIMQSPRRFFAHGELGDLRQ